MDKFGSVKFEGNKKIKKKLKIGLNSINYFYMFLQTHFIYFLLLYKD